ncbi:MAG TPA: hypothetical protein HPP87_09845 [Planctomycetes bacterium]|nr:hypothetical protein [Planctomycetota bacterium]HIJ71649.1 hypothetical protein [Planctomycetota bacterium]
MAENLNPHKKYAFSGWPMIILWAGIFVFSFHACTHMVAAGDTWVALACGRHFSNHGVDTVEPFSANSHKPGPTEDELAKYPEWLHGAIKYWHPTGWINQNWGTHYLFFWLARTFGSEGNYNYDALIYWKFIVTLIGAIATYYIARVIGVCPLLSAIGACFAPFVGRTFIDVRPAVFSNILTPILILVFVLATYKDIRYIWLVVPVTVFWCNVHGGYLYVFMVGVLFVGMHFITIPFGRRFVTIGKRGVVHTIAAGFAAFIAMIIFNPFHLTNLTHTFVITISENAKSWRTVNEWHRAFEWKNPVGEETAFLVMYIIAWVVLVLWLLAGFFKTSPTSRRARQIEKADSAPYQRSKIDLPLITIAAFTVYMALRSRRFIPIAASVACPVMAVFLQETICIIAARIQAGRNQKHSVPAMSKIFQRALWVIATVTVLFFGCFWGAKFKRVYLDPWPVDGKYDSLFMRMTASYLKPTDVGRFIRENKLSGKMFNYWTEGGAIAFAQEPDPETGKTPLQLFMDGRAQAAYDHRTFLLWNHIKSGGPVVQNARMARRKLTNADYRKMGKWIDQEMKKRDVWVILMPANELNSTFVKGLGKSLNWATVYADTYQRMWVDTDTQKGKKLLTDVLAQKASFPNEFARNLTLAAILLRAVDPQAAQVGYQHAAKAFRIRPSQLSLFELVYAAGRKELKKTVFADIKSYLDNFTNNKDDLSAKDDYERRLLAAARSGEYLASHFRRTKPELSKKYAQLVKKYTSERVTISTRSRW